MSLLTPLRTRREERQEQRDAAFLAAAEASLRVHEPITRPEPNLKKIKEKVLPPNTTVVALQKELDWVRSGGDATMRWNQGHGIYQSGSCTDGCVVGHVNYVHNTKWRLFVRSDGMTFAARHLGITYNEAQALWGSYADEVEFRLEMLIKKYQ